MGMFDRLYDKQGVEWQTKAYECNLDAFRLGDRVPDIEPYEGLATYQVEVLGGPGEGLTDSLATVREGHLYEVPSRRDHSLPLVNYSGHVVEGGDQ